jgi:mono/diheme cytochrome c family protein
MNALRIFALVSLWLIPSCSKSDPSSGTSAAITHTPAAPPAVGEAFKARCAPCHGVSGHGDGPAVVKLDAKPPNCADTAWQKSVTDEEIRKAIVYGGAAVGKSPSMPASRDLEGKPELDELLALVRSFSGT